ncbi:potassium channel family protein [Streptomyces pathocidini]|uniref:Potassium channel family protein n=1 Tax=Streptomyces pathocidini TaxID=1650571 RepID=A0ABW7USY2_9ACTN|nr:potassium channel family protein [Streptomyces pathocidini]
MNDDSRMLSWERRTTVPLFVASLLFLTSYAVRVLVHDLSPGWDDLWLLVTAVTWTSFFVDYAVRLVLSGQGLRFVHHHLLDTVVLVLPLLRPLRVVQMYTVLKERQAQARLSLYGRVMAYASVTALLLGFAASLAVYQAERGAPGASIRTFGDAVWWACSTLTTTGYGDVAPVTPRGRVVATVLMACGLALLGAVTGSFSSWLLQVFTREDEEGPSER